MRYEYTDQQAEFQAPDVGAPERYTDFSDIPDDIPEDRSEYGAETSEVPEIAEDTGERGAETVEMPEIPEDTVSDAGAGENMEAPEIPEDTVSGAEIKADAEAPEIPEDTAREMGIGTETAPEIPEDTYPDGRAADASSSDMSGNRDSADEYAEIGGWPKAGDISSLEEALSDTNPNYDEGEEWQVNCQRCVPTYEMRRRGYDVSAQPCVDDMDSLAISPFDVWENPEVIDCPDDDRNTIIDEMSQWEDGARAQIVVMWENGEGGHTFIAEKENGEIRFVDPQTGDTECSDYFDEIEPGSTRFCRIDNLKPSEKILECCKEAK